jgi:hypothetical protein
MRPLLTPTAKMIRGTRNRSTELTSQTSTLPVLALVYENSTSSAVFRSRSRRNLTSGGSADSARRVASADETGSGSSSPHSSDDEARNAAIRAGRWGNEKRNRECSEHARDVSGEGDVIKGGDELNAADAILLTDMLANHIKFEDTSKATCKANGGGTGACFVPKLLMLTNEENVSDAGDDGVR